ncbi:Uncharacterized protein UCP029693, DUF2333 [Desulfonema limicola]|uniref:Uncharacterized protein UCP029693, DUF2333 n=1 Tax=Desulfonema limicola TaxID=45656 RepID=A0A975B4B2_9BACT|nr:DUF2333 family protein [Desulfonema limicola]QTA78526.1 Uncharacterized protein UCP029693, DUF2333 [Desulfonema limicola]
MKNIKKLGKNEKGASKYAVLAVLTIVLFLGIWTFFQFMGKGSSDKTAPVSSHKTQTENIVKEYPKNQPDSTAKTHDTAANKTPAKAHAVPKTVAAASVFKGVRGVAFVSACIKPLDYELNERFWGWRSNDIINITDNVNNFQLGVLEVTRRTAVALTESISRTGKSDAYVPSLEYAMNWFMIKPTKYWFPSAESKYKEGLKDLKTYMDMVKTGEAGFYRRVDNLVPLLKSYESILGSCDENLVKALGDLSFFKADDVLYYSKGVASSMKTILEAVSQDFDDTIKSVQGDDVMHHAIVSLDHASHVDPIIVLEGKPSGLTANHRANMAASISHARFYLDVLIVALTGNI